MRVAVSANKTASMSKPKHLWKPGQSGNPSGRPKSARTALLELSHGGKDLAGRMFEVWMGNVPEFKAQQRMEAGKWCCDHVYGKAPEIHAIAGIDPDSPEGAAVREITSLALSDIVGIVKQLPAADTIEVQGELVSENTEQIPADVTE